MALSVSPRKKCRLSQQPRRARPQEPDTDTDSDQEAARALFKRHFEQQFAPLPQIKSNTEQYKEQDGINNSLHDEGQAESDFGGFESEEEDQEVIQIVEHHDVESLDESAGPEKRSFMTSAPPQKASRRAVERSKEAAAEAADDERSEKLNLKNDLELQRLINESHLLDSSKKADKQQRQRITDLRLQSLGSKTSILQQAKMPLAHRKGINAKKDRLEKKRRQEALENGVVLEKAVRKAPTSNAKRDRGVGGPAIGRYKGGTLNLSQRDVAAITRPRRK